MIKYSEARDVNAEFADNYRKEPCPFECGMNPFLKQDEAMSIEESITNNFWKNNIPINDKMEV